MAIFQYTAMNELGQSKKGTIEADSLDAAKRLLSEQELFPTKLVEKKSGGKKGESFLTMEFGTQIKVKELVLFTKQMRTMLKAGISILDILITMEKQTDNAKLKKVAIEMGRDIKEGSNLYDAFKKHPKVFSNLYCNMLRAGEVSGALPEVLDRLILILEHEEKIKSDIKSATRYPKFVMMALVAAFFVLLLMVIPNFVSIFSRAGLELPLPTRICLAMHAVIAGYWQYSLSALIAIVGGIKYWFKTEKGAYLKDLFLLKVPIIGPLFMKASMSRFASILSILQASGVAILDSFSILSETIGNKAMSSEFDKIGEKLTEGKGISQPLREAKFFPPMVVNMISVGEDTGELEEMMKEVSHHYDAEVDFATKQLAEAITPILTVGLTAVVGFFMFAIFLPMWDLTKMAH